MSGKTTAISQEIEDMLDILEEDVQHIERTISHLAELRGFVIKRDEKRLARLLEDIRAEAQRYSASEHSRRLIRERLAGRFGCKPGELTLSVLGARAGEPAGTALAEVRKKLRALVVRLQSEYASTAALLSDCARINSLLLKAVFERGRSGLVCYDSGGAAKRDSDAAFMSVRF